MSKLDLETAEESEFKLPTSVASQKNKENSRKTSTSALLTIKDDAMKVLHSVFQKIWKTQQWPQDLEN